MRDIYMKPSSKDRQQLKKVSINSCREKQLNLMYETKAGKY